MGSGSDEQTGQNRMRNLAGKFLPGVSGNPSGRPAIVSEIQALARSHTASAINTLVEIMQSASTAASARVAAAVALLDRGYGRPTSAVIVETVVQDFSPEREALITEL